MAHKTQLFTQFPTVCVVLWFLTDLDVYLWFFILWTIQWMAHSFLYTVQPYSFENLMRNVNQKSHRTRLWMLTKWTWIFNRIFLYCQCAHSALVIYLYFVVDYEQKMYLTENWKWQQNVRIINSRYCKQQYRTSHSTDLMLLLLLCVLFYVVVVVVLFFFLSILTDHFERGEIWMDRTITTITLEKYQQHVNV